MATWNKLLIRNMYNLPSETKEEKMRLEMHGGVSNFLPHACCRKGWHDDWGEAEEGHTTAKLIPHLLLIFSRLLAQQQNLRSLSMSA